MDHHSHLTPGADARGTLEPPRAALVLYNDAVHSFNEVIDALMDICGHDYVQAEQCAVLIHYRGSLAVKYGAPEVLRTMQKKFQRLEFKVKIEN